MTKLDQIDHFIVLMLENRSFDNLLGALYPASPAFNGLTGKESNPYHNRFSPTSDSPPLNIPVWCDAPGDKRTMTIPTPDPAELYVDMVQQIFADHPPGPEVPNMQGFVDNYAKNGGDPYAIMHHFPPSQVPVLSTLAKAFAVCDQWHASAPCQTWPNRFFVHTGTANGYPNNSPLHFPYLMPTIFNRLHEKNLPWHIYFSDFPQALTLSELWPHVEHFRLMHDFFADAEAGKLPAYAFLEPRYFADLDFPNDQHPPHDVTFGEQLLAQVYNAVRASPCWKKSLLIITYDEHGGCYDHAPPPMAVPPDDKHDGTFRFDRYGVRVPAVLISPYIRPGTILRAAAEGLPHQGPPYPFDHTSIIATLRQRFGIEQPLTRRDAVAPTLDAVLNLDAPSNDGPDAVTVPACEFSAEELEAARNAPLTEFQKVALLIAWEFPLLPHLSGQGWLKRIEKFLWRLIKPLIDRFASRGKYVTEAAQEIKKLLF